MYSIWFFPFLSFFLRIGAEYSMANAAPWRICSAQRRNFVQQKINTNHSIIMSFNLFIHSLLLWTFHFLHAFLACAWKTTTATTMKTPQSFCASKRIFLHTPFANAFRVLFLWICVEWQSIRLRVGNDWLSSLRYRKYFASKFKLKKVHRTRFEGSFSIVDVIRKCGLWAQMCVAWLGENVLPKMKNGAAGTNERFFFFFLKIASGESNAIAIFIRNADSKQARSSKVLQHVRRERVTHIEKC